MSELVRPTEVGWLPAGPVEYRLERRGEPVVVMLHGGHMRAGLALGEDVFAEAGCTLLATSRPGYGRTPVMTVAEFADVTWQLCEHLGIGRVAAVVGVSAGGTTAATVAARHREIERLILISAMGWLPYPDRWTRLGARVAFRGGAERVTWAGIHRLATDAPELCLRMMMRGLSTRPVNEVTAGLRDEDRTLLLEMFGQMRSGRGFLNDLRGSPDVAAEVGQPTLVIATRNDGGVPFAHAERYAATIRNAELVESRADSHIVWFGEDWPDIAARIRRFLLAL
jgi:pimeloyl-ACP methyl ester carboxylesterase